jgi:anti-sigma regulatory factor (Ser/Thr protein kinase)
VSRQMTLTLPAAGQAPWVARQVTRETLAAWRVSHLEETAVLLISELVTNAVRHARPGRLAMALCLEADGARLLIEVHDADPHEPRHRAPGALDESGFGLLLVEALAGKWGVRQTVTGKAVWAEMDARQVANHP